MTTTTEVLAALQTPPAAAPQPPPETETETAILAALGTLSESRRTSLLFAIRAGADAPTLRTLAQADRLARSGSIVLPARYGGCSRAKGWARLGRGSSAEWGETDGSGYRVRSAGTWTVESSDGFHRHERVTWTVDHVQVGDATWTIAS